MVNLPVAWWLAGGLVITLIVIRLVTILNHALERRRLIGQCKKSLFTLQKSVTEILPSLEQNSDVLPATR